MGVDSAYDLDQIQLEFVQWVVMYYNVMTNLMPEDRAEAMRVIDNDAKFDAWTERFASKSAPKNSKIKPGMVRVDEDTFFERVRKVVPAMIPPPLGT